MLQRILIAALLATALAGCGDDDAGQVTTTLPELVCPDPVTVGTQEQLVAALAATLWEEGAADLAVQGTVSLESAAVPLSEDCLAANDCRHEAALYLPNPVPGVTLEGPDAAAYDLFEDSRTLVFTDAAVRVTATLRDTHPGRFNFVPTLSVHPPCGTPCDEGLRLCPTDGLCYDFDDHYLGWCLGCEGLGRRECACRDASGTRPDGARCEFNASGDVMCGGTCQEGICVSGDGAGC